MFRPILIFLILSGVSLQIAGQNLNLNKLGELSYQDLHNSEISDLWGYEDGNGNEYAIVGVNDTGVSIVDVTDPANPVEVYYSQGVESSTWRDIVVHNDHAYIVNEGDGGLKIIDLSPLPGSTNLTESTYTGSGSWSTAHNLFIDENGKGYIFGANRGEGGVIILDLFTDPMNPTELGEYDASYIHDGYVRGDTLYSCHINDGEFRIVDVSDPTSPQVLGSHSTPNDYAHNAWLSDDGDHLYTTDEVSDGYIGAYDVSDPSNIQEVDRIRTTPGSGSIPHNTHFINEYLVTSYYRDGVTIHDVSRPGNMVLTGRYDTSPELSGDGFDGSWGVYPWLPSGNIIASDIDSGLMVLGPDYRRGCYLEGNVTDQGTGAPINDAKVTIVPDSVVDHSDITGEYATGIGEPDLYDVIYSKPIYFPDTLYDVPLSEDSLTLRDVQLERRPQYDLFIEVETSSGDPVENAEVSLQWNGPDESATTDASGEALLTGVHQSEYELHAGKWGFMPYCDDSLVVDGPDTLTFVFQEGYGDDFALDLGWNEQSFSNTGHWERGEPNGTYFQGIPINPEVDVDGDCGDQAFVTGNQGTDVADDQVDTLSTILISPSIDASNWNDARLRFNYWFLAATPWGSYADDDTLFVRLDDDGQLSTVDTITSPGVTWRDREVDLSGELPLSNNLKVRFEAADPDGNTVTEAAIDKFRIGEGPLSIEEEGEEDATVLQVMPNPFKERLNLDWGEDRTVSVELFDMQGRKLRQRSMQGRKGGLEADDLDAGIYLLLVRDDETGEAIGKQRVVKEAR